MLDTVLRFKNTGSTSSPFETTLERLEPKSAAEMCGAMSFVNSSLVCKSSSLLVYIEERSFPFIPSNHALDSLDKKNLCLVFRMSFFASSCSSMTSCSVLFNLVP